jgi:hypothetical protein
MDDHRKERRVQNQATTFKLDKLKYELNSVESTLQLSKVDSTLFNSYFNLSNLKVVAWFCTRLSFL